MPLSLVSIPFLMTHHSPLCASVLMWKLELVKTANITFSSTNKAIFALYDLTLFGSACTHKFVNIKLWVFFGLFYLQVEQAGFFLSLESSEFSTIWLKFTGILLLNISIMFISHPTLLTIYNMLDNLNSKVDQ